MKTLEKLWDSPRTTPVIVLICTLAMWGAIAWLAPLGSHLMGASILAAVVQLMIGTMFLGEHIPGHGWLDTEKSWHRDTTLLASPAAIPYLLIKSGISIFFLLVWISMRSWRRLHHC